MRHGVHTVKYDADSHSDLLEPQNGAFWSALGRLGTLRWSRLAKEGPRTPSGVQKLSQNGGQLRLKIESKIVLISGAEKVVDLEAQKLEKRTLGTSKTSQIHWRGCKF